MCTPGSKLNNASVCDAVGDMVELQECVMKWNELMQNAHVGMLESFAITEDREGAVPTPLTIRINGENLMCIFITLTHLMTHIRHTNLWSVCRKASFTLEAIELGEDLDSFQKRQDGITLAFQNVDTDKSGNISVEEYTQWATTHSGGLLKPERLLVYLEFFRS